MQEVESGKGEFKLCSIFVHVTNPLWQFLETLGFHLFASWTMISLDEAPAETLLRLSSSGQPFTRGLGLCRSGPDAFFSPVLCLLFQAEFYPPKIRMLIEGLAPVPQKGTISGDRIFKELIKEK